MNEKVREAALHRVRGEVIRTERRLGAETVASLTTDQRFHGMVLRLAKVSRAMADVVLGATSKPSRANLESALIDLAAFAVIWIATFQEEDDQ